jgi:hypothetical protein
MSLICMPVQVERNRERCNLENSDSGIPEVTLQRLLAIEVGVKEKTDKSEALAEEVLQSVLYTTLSIYKYIYI